MSNQVPDQNRSIYVGNDVTGSAMVTGDSNTVSVAFQQASLPQPETVDIKAELIALQEILASLNDPVATGVAQKLKEEASKPKPDKNIVATTLETGLTYGKNLSNFAETIDKLQPRVTAIVAWLGKHGHKLLPLVGLAL
ncbi:hypothetical protein [Gloeothece verrucosa]|uniref:Uncharacterized protein n=1 Tax=Gloeothece verrucosa (strain PCC 7822) TaxID=497965 RepID=E0UIW5_GLOV7|nr:hypothetical protein [Gloeothece verrucosa]ADN14545.1 hypothetical protein Cyan7822_2574 [Gloeothece verrucosa PCC 7822]